MIFNSTHLFCFTHQTAFALGSDAAASPSASSFLDVMSLLFVVQAFLMSSWCRNFLCCLSLEYSILTSFRHLVDTDCDDEDDDEATGSTLLADAHADATSDEGPDGGRDMVAGPLRGRPQIKV